MCTLQLAVISYACQLIYYTFPTEEIVGNVRVWQSAHFAIAFQILEMSSITTPDPTILNFHAKYIFQ